ncbi:hypothetical protein KMZ32_18155 [Phycicoccus sp. MAQZ13P-2]|uniref:hypothetical protein n=1 Tax=Phycicoccus mangrovi TaxID=2840470 RepID=UPI001C0067A6|nr:hypothetical protein [Phycicoccus mangrovi]MBT9258017.1 hypothetical protein [Phycicoccus mangrovi]MBT9276001.1 hypothetical protein [Phycicoccus mangrovi]
MSHPHDETDPVEHDPTGMRALLGSLPDPGPMPADLVARIEAALAAEARALEAPGADRPGRRTPVPTDVVVPLRRRRRWQLVAVAASAVAVLGLGGVVLQTMNDGGVSASLGLAGGSSDSAGAEADPQQAPAGGVDLLAEDDTLGVVVLESGRSYSTAALPSQVVRGLPWDRTGRDTSAGPSGSPTGKAQVEAQDGGGAASTLGVLATAAGARACAEGLDVPDADTVVVDLATVDGAPAAVLVATAESGRRTVWAVQRDCTRSAAHVVSGPVVVD